MEIEFDPVKHARTLADRKLDFRDAVLVFNSTETTVGDARRDYGEERFRTIGTLETMYVAVAWTRRFREGREVRRIISMRRANDREIEAHLQRLGEGDARPG